jgi:hypothetical protein
VNERIKLNEELNKHGLSTDDIDKLLNLLLNAKDYGFDTKKITGKLRSIKRLEKKEKGLEYNCTILTKQLQKYKEIIPLAERIVALNIDISELLALDTAVNQLAKEYDLPPYVAAFRLFADIRDYNKVGGLSRNWNINKSITRKLTTI